VPAAKAYHHAKFHLDPSNRLVTTHVVCMLCIMSFGRVKTNKSSAVAEIGVSGHNRIDMGRKEGDCSAAVPLWGEAGSWVAI